MMRIKVRKKDRPSWLAAELEMLLSGGAGSADGKELEVWAMGEEASYVVTKALVYLGKKLCSEGETLLIRLGTHEKEKECGMTWLLKKL